jgi:hypothetical protein
LALIEGFYPALLPGFASGFIYKLTVSEDSSLCIERPVAA